MTNFNKGTISIGKELAISLDLVVNDEITLMSTSNLQTPFGNLPLQEKFKISSVFSTGLAEFDHNVIFMPIESASALFELLDTDINLKNHDNVFLIILKSAIYELLYKPATSSKIIIKEYLNASNYFIDDSKTKYLNALLDKISKNLRFNNE